MRIELLKEIVNSIIGEKSKGIVELLFEKENVNEFVIAKKLNLTINQTRNLLYKLSDEGLVSVSRKKNKSKGGWYDHFWTLNLEKSLLKFKEVLLKKKETLMQSAALKKSTRFYVCETCGIEVTEEQALMQDYTCQECGQLLVLKDNTKEIATIEKEYAHLDKDLAEVLAEIAILDQKNAKAGQRRQKAFERKKAKDRAIKRIASAAKRKSTLEKNKSAKKK